MDKHRSNLLLAFCIVLAVTAAAIIVWSYRVSSKPQQTQTIPQTFADINPGPKTTTILAPNGLMSLVINEETSKGTITDTFSVSDANGGPQKQIYSETLAEGTTITVPYNTFSPDNKYIFLRRNSPTEQGYFVLKTDGTPFKNAEKTIDFVSLFNSKYPNTPASDVTGWGGMTLIVVNVEKPGGGVDRSYWYDVASNSIIPLSTRFN